MLTTDCIIDQISTVQHLEQSYLCNHHLDRTTDWSNKFVTRNHHVSVVILHGHVLPRDNRSPPVQLFKRARLSTSSGDVTDDHDIIIGTSIHNIH